MESSACIVGGSGNEPLPGATTLELFGLTADSVHQRLVPATLYLMAAAGPTVRQRCALRFAGV
jgi:hypothetical protein